MFYEGDFARSRDRINKLQIFSRKLHNRAERKRKFQKFADSFTLHGFCYIFDRNSQTFERYLWALCLISSIITCIYVCSMISSKYNDRTLRTVVEDSQYPVFNIEFPAVGICMRHRVNYGRFEQAKRKFLPPNASAAMVDMFSRFVMRIDALQFKTFDFLRGIEDEPVHLLDSISITDLATYLAFRCQEVIYGTCLWAEQPFDCCKMFIQERTTIGMCLVFNSIVSAESKQKAISDKFYPYKNSKNGEGSGLVFTLVRNSSNLVPGVKKVTGIDIMIKKPNQWTDERTYYIRPNTYNGVMVKPEIVRTHEELRAFPVSMRKCQFTNEKWKHWHSADLEYRQWNCRAQCYQSYLIKYCNCTITMFFRGRGVKARECTASDYICVYRNRELFSNDRPANIEKFIKQKGPGMFCPCPYNCNSLSYYVTLNPIPLNESSSVNTTTHIDVYFQSEVMLKYLTTLEFTTLDLIGYFGGLATLFLGASIISGVEFLHLALTELILYLKEKKHDKRAARKIIKVRPT